MQLSLGVLYSSVYLMSLWREQAAEKVELTLAAVVHNHNFLRRTYKLSIRTAINEANYDSNYNLTKLYHLNYELIFLRSYSPPEILKALCDQVLHIKANAILYLSDMKYTADRTAGAQYFLGVARFLGLPLIGWTGYNSGLAQPGSEPNILYLTPSIVQQCKVMLHILMRYEWHHFSIVTGGVAGRDHFINALRALVEDTKYDFEIESVIKIESLEEEHISRGLASLEKSETRVILFYASEDEAKIILPLAKQRGLNGKEMMWIISQLAFKLGNEFLDPDYWEDELPMNTNERNKHLFPGMLGVGYKADDETRNDALYYGAKVWVMGIEAMVNDQSAWVNNISLVPQIQCQNVNEDAQWKNGALFLEQMKKVSTEDPPIHFEEDGTHPDLTLLIVNLNMKHKWQQVGRWNKKTGLKMDEITWPENSAKPPQGKPSRYHLKVATLQEKPYVVYSNPDPKTGDCSPEAELCRIAPEHIANRVPNPTTNSSLYQCCSGICVDILNMLSNKIGFDFELFEVEDKRWGAYDIESQNWNGLIRSAIDGDADMVMTSLKITAERNRVIDFSVPFLGTGIGIIVAAVKGSGISPTLFLDPFDYTTWCLILIFAVHASGVAVFLFEWFSPNGLDRGTSPNQEHRFSMFGSIWLIWALTFGAAVRVNKPRGLPSRFLTIIWALFAVVFTAVYTARLFTLVIVNTNEHYDQVTGIQDWRLMKPTLHRPPFKFATVAHGSTETFIKRNYPDMYKWMRPYNRSTVMEGVRSVKRGELNAFIYDATVLENLARNDDACKLVTVGNWAAKTGFGIGFPKGSKWVEKVNKYITQFQLEGDIDRLQKFWLPGPCKKNENEEYSMPLGLYSFSGPFIFLAGGLLLGSLILVLEHVFFSVIREKLRIWNQSGWCSMLSSSLGKSLTNGHSAKNDASLQKHFKCKNPNCNMQMWKLKHKLDIALLKLDKFEKQQGSIDTPKPLPHNVEWGKKKKQQKEKGNTYTKLEDDEVIKEDETCI